MSRGFGNCDMLADNVATKLTGRVLPEGWDSPLFLCCKLGKEACASAMELPDGQGFLHMYLCAFLSAYPTILDLGVCGVTTVDMVIPHPFYWFASSACVIVPQHYHNISCSTSPAMAAVLLHHKLVSVPISSVSPSTES